MQNTFRFGFLGRSDSIAGIKQLALNNVTKKDSCSKARERESGNLASINLFTPEFDEGKL